MRQRRAHSHRSLQQECPRSYQMKLTLQALPLQLRCVPQHWLSLPRAPHP
jgi:hypothetical protein